MVRIQQGVKPQVVTAVAAVPEGRDPNVVALTAWLDALIQHATAQQVRRRLEEVSARLRKGERWLAEHGVEHARYDEAYTLYRTLELEAEHLLLNLNSLRKVGWHWCGMTWEALKRATPGWGDGIEEPPDTSSVEAIWRGLWGEEPPAAWPPSERDHWVERRLATVEIWNLSDMRDRWKGLDA